MLAERLWRRTTWRHGPKGKRAARFASIRVRVAAKPEGGAGDGAVWGNNRHLLGQEAWRVGDWRASGKRKYDLSTLPLCTSVRALAAAIRARWVGKQVHQQLKGELELGFFEGRSWTGVRGPWPPRAKQP